MKYKWAYIGFAFLHHKGTHAGYHQIADYLPYDEIIDIQSFFEKEYRERTFFRKIFGKIIQCFTSFHYVPWFLLGCIVNGYRNPYTIYHHIYGECTLNNIKPFLCKKNKIVCTFHQPFAWYEQNKRFLKCIKSLDAVILVGNAEVEKFQSITKKNNVFFIPHGIRTDFYKPDFSIKKQRMLLTVGNWLRDYDFANEVYLKLLEDDPDIEVNVVALPENCKAVSEHPHVHFHHGISDEQLKDLYCRCSVLFLPLLRYTANNALLEAAATGCNIVISSNNHDNSYIPEKFLRTTKMDVEEAVSVIKSSMTMSYNEELAHYVDENYSWQKIALKTGRVFDEISQG